MLARTLKDYRLGNCLEKPLINPHYNSTSSFRDDSADPVLGMNLRKAGMYRKIRLCTSDWILLGIIIPESVIQKSLHRVGGPTPDPRYMYLSSASTVWYRSAFSGEESNPLSPFQECANKHARPLLVGCFADYVGIIMLRNIPGRMQF